MKLWVKILIALFLGTAVGLVFGQPAAALKPIGDGFLRMINMVIVPLIISTMTVGITSIHDPQKLGRVGLKTLFLYLITTLIAIVIGVSLAKIFQPGEGLRIGTTEVITTPNETPNFTQMFVEVIPANPVLAMAESNVLQLIVFALFLGLSINFAGEKARPFSKVLESLADVMYRMTSLVMEFSPIGVFALMAWVSGTFGYEALFNLLKFLVVYYVGALLHILIVFCGLLYFFLRLKPLPFFKGMSDAIAVAFSTASSSAALPVTMHCVKENLGVSKNIGGFVLPLGSTVNMNGAAMFQGMAALFVAQAYGIELSWMALITIVVTATMSAIGAAGIPGSGYIMLGVVFKGVGLPLEALGLLAGIDRLREMMSATLNVMGDAICAVYVAKQEGELDEQRYYHEELIELESA